METSNEHHSTQMTSLGEIANDEFFPDFRRVAYQICTKYAPGECEEGLARGHMFGGRSFCGRDSSSGMSGSPTSAFRPYTSRTTGSQRVGARGAAPMRASAMNLPPVEHAASDRGTSDRDAAAPTDRDSLKRRTMLRAVEDGEGSLAADPEMNLLVDNLISRFTKLRETLLLVNDKEASFRQQYRSSVESGLWNRYVTQKRNAQDGAETNDANDSSGLMGIADEGDFIEFNYNEPVVTEDQTSMPVFNQPTVVDNEGSANEDFGDEEYKVHLDHDAHGRMSHDKMGRVGQFRPDQECSARLSPPTAAARKNAGKFDKQQVQPLMQWLLENSENPYPSTEIKATLSKASGLSLQQVQNWFINMRKRHWNPMRNGKRKPRTFLDFVIASSTGMTLPIGAEIEKQGGRKKQRRSRKKAGKDPKPKRGTSSKRKPAFRAHARRHPPRGRDAYADAESDSEWTGDSY